MSHLSEKESHVNYFTLLKNERPTRKDAEPSYALLLFCVKHKYIRCSK